MLLNWEGPFRYLAANSINPPNESGVYLWVINSKRGRYVVCVGKAASIKDRLYEHMVYMLGGSGYLYEVTHLREADGLQREYIPDAKSWNREFLNKYSKFSALAYENLISYEFFWAKVAGDNPSKEMVESCLIKAIIDNENDCGRIFDSEGLKVSRKPCPLIKVSSSFPEGVKIVGLDRELQYELPGV